MSKKVLVLFAHPLFEKSRIHASLVKAIPRITEVTFHDLYEFYPDFNINIRYEQEQLKQHDIIILQHPFYWYSVPPMIKQWIDMVLEYGWAYGTGGTALQGKWLINVISTGGKFDAYQREGKHKYSIREFLFPIEQTAKLCHLEYLPPFVIHGTHHLSPEEIKDYSQQYRHLIEQLACGSIKASDYNDQAYMNNPVNTEANGR